MNSSPLSEPYGSFMNRQFLYFSWQFPLGLESSALGVGPFPSFFYLEQIINPTSHLPTGAQRVGRGRGGDSETEIWEVIGADCGGVGLSGEGVKVFCCRRAGAQEG